MTTRRLSDEPSIRRALTEVLEACELILLSQRQALAAVEPLIAAVADESLPVPAELVARARLQVTQAKQLMGPAEHSIERFRKMLGAPSARH